MLGEFTLNKHLSVFAILIVILFFAIVVVDSHAQDDNYDPTKEALTLDAVVQSYFDATHTAQFTQPTPNPSSTPNPATATAQFEQKIQERFDTALTATADAQSITEYRIEASLAGSQNVNIRDCPSTSCVVVGQITAGEVFQILRVEEDWYIVTTEEIVTPGYVYAPLVTVPAEADLSKLPTPVPSPTATSTPLPPTATPDISLTATVEALGLLAEPKSDGIYLAGIDIAYGKWHSTGTGTGCYWEIDDEYGEILANNYGEAGGTLTIIASAFQVELNDCGLWEYVENRPRKLSIDANEPKDSGFYTVGVEIAPGRWRSTGKSDGCYWERLDDTQDIIENHYGLSGGAVYISPDDYEVHFSDCGQWEYLSPP